MIWILEFIITFNINSWCIITTINNVFINLYYCVQGYLKKAATTDEMEDAYGALSSGYGFASFCYIIAFIMATATSIYYSPLFCGSSNEKTMIKNPDAADFGGEDA